MHLHHLSFNMAVSLLMLGMIGISIPNIYYFESIYSNGGTPHIGKTSAAIMFAFNILSIVVESVFFIWAIIRIFSDYAATKPTGKGGIHKRTSELYHNLY